MNAEYLVRSIRSLTRYEPSGDLKDGDPLKVILAAWDGEERRYPVNIVVYGGDKDFSNDFAEVADACRQPDDALLRIGTGPGRGIWIAEDDRILNILNSRVLYVPGEEKYSEILSRWRQRTDYIYVGPGSHQDKLIASNPGDKAAWPRRPKISHPKTEGKVSKNREHFHMLDWAASSPDFQGEQESEQADQEWYFPEYDLHVAGTSQPPSEYRLIISTRQHRLAGTTITLSFVGLLTSQVSKTIGIELVKSPANRWKGMWQGCLELNEPCNLRCEGPSR